MKAGRRVQLACFALFGCLVAGPAFGAAQALRWQSPSGSDVPIAGYRLYMGDKSGEYDRVFDLGLPHLEGTDVFGAVVEVPEGEVLYGALASYDREGNESEFSEEMILKDRAPEAADRTAEAPEPLSGGEPVSATASLRAMGVTTGQARRVTSPPGDPRLFVVDRVGNVRLIEGGFQRAEPFLDLDDQTGWVDGGGLMSLAFDPDYAENGYLYIAHTDGEGYFLLTRFKVGDDGYSVDRFSAVEILEVLLPYRGNPGGGLAFGLDGNLFVAVGDGGEWRLQTVRVHAQVAAVAQQHELLVLVGERLGRHQTRPTNTDIGYASRALSAVLTSNSRDQVNRCAGRAADTHGLHGFGIGQMQIGKG